MTLQKEKQVELSITPIIGDKSLPPIKTQFNPDEYSLSKSNQFASIAIPGRNSPIIQFVKGEAQNLYLELFFDTYTFEGGKDVREQYTKKITDLLTINPDLHAPPICEVEWDGKLQFIGIIERVDTKFTMFNKDGIPVRAKLNVLFKQYSEIEGKRHSPDRTKRRVVKEGETLWQIAFAEYGDSDKWKIIASENDIDDPKKIKAGSKIVLPPLK